MTQVFNASGTGSTTTPERRRFQQPAPLQAKPAAGSKSDIIPQDVGELYFHYRSYIIGGLRNLGISSEDVDDRLQDVVLHCQASNFFLRVKEKVDAGLMNPKQFRAYLGTTIHNVLVNKYKESSRDPSSNAASTDVDGSDDDYQSGISLDRYLDPETEGSDHSIPSTVIENDIIRFVADRKPAFVPTLILWLQDHRPSDIARIIGKKKETIHYRMKAIFDLLAEYYDRKGETSSSNGGAEEHSSPHELVVGKTYRLVGANPFKREPPEDLYRHVRTLCDVRDGGVTMTELVSITGRLMEQGRFPNTVTAEVAVKAFLACAKERGAVVEAEVEMKEAAVASGKAGRRCRYQVTATENPYKWATGGGYAIFEAIKGYEFIDLPTLTSLVKSLVDAGVLKSKRSAEDIAWGFIETSRGYKALRRSDG